MVRSVAGNLPEQVKNNQSVNTAAGNGGQKMSQYSWFTVYENKEKKCRFSFLADKIKGSPPENAHKNTVLSFDVIPSYKRTVYFSLRLDLILIYFFRTAGKNRKTNLSFILPDLYQNTTVKTTPDPVFSTRYWNPCNSKIVLTRYSPRPLPPVDLFRDFSTR